MQTLGIRRRDFIAAAAAFAAARGRAEDAAARQRRLVDKWEEATCLVAPADYARYMHDGDTRGLIALKAAELAFDRVLKAAKSTIVAGDAPAVWSVYNMGYVVKTRKSLFAIDLKHRRAAEFAPLLDFALVTHMFQCHSPKSSHPLPLQQSPKDCSIHLCLFCCLTYRVIITIFLNSIYMH